MDWWQTIYPRLARGTDGDTLNISNLAIKVLISWLGRFRATSCLVGWFQPEKHDRISWDRGVGSLMIWWCLICFFSWKPCARINSWQDKSVFFVWGCFTCCLSLIGTSICVHTFLTSFLLSGPLVLVCGTSFFLIAMYFCTYWNMYAQLLLISLHYVPLAGQGVRVVPGRPNSTW